MKQPVRFVATSYNLWAGARWPEREPALRAYIEASKPDILCLQELRPATRRVLDEALPGHQRVDEAFEGWLNEGNIYWSKDIFDLEALGAEDIGMLEELRRLFWVRLAVRGRSETLLVSTAHYTWTGNRRERDEGFSPRLAQAEKTLEALGRIARPNEAVLFMGDLNDNTNAISRLRAGGLTDVFNALGTQPVPTHPALPTAQGTPQVLDWQFFRGPIRPMSWQVVDFYHDDLAPSDHKPVVATYGLD